MNAETKNAIQVRYNNYIKKYISENNIKKDTTFTKTIMTEFYKAVLKFINNINSQSKIKKDFPGSSKDQIKEIQKEYSKLSKSLKNRLNALNQLKSEDIGNKSNMYDCLIVAPAPAVVAPVSAVVAPAPAVVAPAPAVVNGNPPPPPPPPPKTLAPVSISVENLNLSKNKLKSAPKNSNAKPGVLITQADVELTEEEKAKRVELAKKLDQQRKEKNARAGKSLCDHTPEKLSLLNSITGFNKNKLKPTVANSKFSAKNDPKNPLSGVFETVISRRGAVAGDDSDDDADSDWED